MSRLQKCAGSIPVRVLGITLAATSLLSGSAAEPHFSQGWSTARTHLIRSDAATAGNADQGGRARIAKEIRSSRWPVRLSDAVTVRSSFLSDRVLILGSSGSGDKGRLPERRLLQEIPVPGAVADSVTVDLNRDGMPDLVFIDFLENVARVYAMTDGGLFEKVATIRVGEGPVRVASGDLDGDGDIDIATANLLDGTVSIALQDESGGFAQARTADPGLEIAASGVFNPAISAAVDYSALKNALTTTVMESGTRKKLQKYEQKSESAYGAGDSRKAVSRLEKLIRYLNKASDRKLSESHRRQLVELAKEIIADILGGASTGVSATIAADPPAISSTGATTLIWTSLGADKATINNGVGEVETSGSMAVSPSATTTYTLVVTAPDGQSVSASTTVTVQAEASNTIYVSAGAGDDAGGNGTAGSPYQSITKGLSVAGIGNVVEAGAGIYDDDLETFPIRVPTGVTLTGAGADATIVLANSSANAAIRMADESSLAAIRVQNRKGDGVVVEGASAITGSAVGSCGASGIVVLSGGALELSSSDVSNNADTGIRFEGTASGSMKGCTIRGNAADGIAVDGGASALESNTITDNARAGVYLFGGESTVASNTIEGNSWWGLIFSDASGSVSSNSLRGNGFEGMAAYGGTGVDVSSNTIGGNGLKGEPGYVTTFAQFVSFDVAGLSVRDNQIGAFPAADLPIGLFVAASTSTTTITGNGIDATGVSSAYPLLIQDASTFEVSSNVIQGGYTGFAMFDTSEATVVSGNSITGSSSLGVLVYGYYTQARGKFRDNSITGCTGDQAFGVFIQDATPDFGTSTDPGGNVFHNLEAGGCTNLLNNQSDVIYAVGNTWDHSPPTAAKPDLTGIPCGVDIIWSKKNTVVY